MEYHYGATFGKKLVKIRIVNTEGRRITLAQSLKRFSVYYLTIISGIIAFVAVYSNDSVMIPTPESMGISAGIDWLEMWEERFFVLDLIFLKFLFFLLPVVNDQGLHDYAANTHCTKYIKQ